MTKLRVALLQMTSRGFDQEANLAKGVEFCRRAKAMGADVALFPEMWNVGYTSFCPERWASNSVDPLADAALVEARRRWAERAVGPDDVYYDGMAFDDCGRDRDMLLVETGEAEGAILADFDLAALRADRRRETWGNAFHHPHRYGALTASPAVPPFLRTDAAGKPYHETQR